MTRPEPSRAATTAPELEHLATQIVTAPHLAARRLMALTPGMGRCLMACGLISCLGVVLAWSWLVLTDRYPGPLTRPLLAAGAHGFASVGFAALLALTGQVIGGKGRVGQALNLVIGLQAVVLMALPMLVVISLAVPALAIFLGLVVVLWLPWALTRMLQVLHGVESVLKVLAMAVISLLGTVIVLALLLSLTGPGLPGAG